MLSASSQIGSSGGLVLNDSENGGIITGVAGRALAAGNDLPAEAETVAATIYLDHVKKNDLQKILKVLEPYDNNMKVETKADLKPSVGIGSLRLDPAEMLKKSLSLDASGEAPAVSIDGQSGKLNTALGLGNETGGLTLNGDLPGLNPDAGANISLPSAGLTGDMDAAVTAPNVSVSTPQLDVPKVNTGLDYKKPKFTMPNFGLPRINLPKADVDASGGVDLPSVRGNVDTPNINLSDPKINLNSESVDLSLPKVDLNGPDVNVGTPNAAIEAPSGKAKWPPKWMVKHPKVKGPDANLNADASLSAPGVDINMPQADIKGADVNVQTPNLEVEPPSGGINWPHRKWKKPKVQAPKADLNLDANLITPDVSVPKVEGGINAADVDVNLPTADAGLKGPRLPVWPHQKWKKRKGVNADIDANVDTPNLSLPNANIEGDIHAPSAELNLPDVDLPSVDAQAPGVDINPPSPKFPWLKLKKPKIHGPKADLSVDGNTPDASLSVPNIDGEISTPGVDANLPQADVDLNGFDGDIKAPSGKVKFPTLKKHNWHLFGPKVKSPDIDAEVKAPELNVAPQASIDVPAVDLDLPQTDVNIEAPNVDVEPPSGKLGFKKPNFKVPRWSFSAPKATAPDVDVDAAVSTPDLNVSAPTVDADINAPDVNLNLPDADLDAPKIDIDTPDVDGPSGKFKWFHLKKPKFGTLKGPKGEVNGKLPAVEAPDADFSANLSAPKIEGGIDNPDLKIGMPSAEVEGPNVDVSPPAGKLHLPKLNLKKLKGPKVKGPELDADLKAPDLSVSPGAALETPDLSLSAPKIQGGFDAPDLDVNGGVEAPTVDTPDVDVSGGKFKMPKFNMPKFGFSGPNVKGPDLNADAGIKGPNLDLSAPQITGDLSPPALDAGLQVDPKANVNVPDLNISTPGLKGPDVDAPSGKFKLPNLDLPKFGFSGPNVKGPDLNADAGIKGPNLNLSAPQITGDLSPPALDAGLQVDPKANVNVPDLNISTPGLKGPDVDAPSGKFKLPNLDLPKFGFSGPNVKGPDLNADAGIKGPNLDLSAPQITGDLSPPALDAGLQKVDLSGSGAQLKTSDPGFDSDLGDFKFPDFKLPGLGLSGPSVNPSLESGIEAPNVGIPSADANISLPDAPKVGGNVQGPNINVGAPKIDANVEKPKLPFFKLPSFGFSSPELDVPSVNPSVEAGVNAPNVSLGNPTADASISIPNVPKVGGDLTGPNVDVRAPTFEVSPEVKASAPGVEGEIGLPRVDSPEVGIPEPELKGSTKSKLKWPFKWGHKSSLGADDEGSGIDSEIEAPFSDMEVPTFKFHNLPAANIETSGGIEDIFSSAKIDTESRDYVVSKGVRLPVVNHASRKGEKIDIMERLRLAQEKLAPGSPTEASVTAPSLEVGASAEAGDSPTVRGGTFKIDKPVSILGLVKPGISTSDENSKLSVGLANMLCLDAKDGDAN